MLECFCGECPCLPIIDAELLHGTYSSVRTSFVDPRKSCFLAGLHPIVEPGFSPGPAVFLSPLVHLLNIYASLPHYCYLNKAMARRLDARRFRFMEERAYVCYS
jgi:hypothetical protein